MTPRQIVAVALRIFAVWLGLQALQSIPALVAKSEAPGFTYASFLFALTAAIVVALWFFPGTIAGKLLPSPTTPPDPAPSPDTWLAMGCALLGMWTLTVTIPRLVTEVLMIKSDHYYSYDLSQVPSWLAATVAGNLVQCAIGIWLLLGGKGLRRIFWWAQHVGRQKAP